MICIQFYVSGKWHDNCGEVNVHCLPSRKPATTNKGNTLKSFNYAPNRLHLIHSNDLCTYSTARRSQLFHVLLVFPLLLLLYALVRFVGR